MIRCLLIKLLRTQVSHFPIPVRLICVEYHQQELQIDYTMSPRTHQNSYHGKVARTQLTRNVGTLYPELRNEITTAFDDIIDPKGNGEPVPFRVLS